MGTPSDVAEYLQVPPASDYDCAGGSGDGPEYTGFVRVTGSDPYGLDSDNDGVGCEQVRTLLASPSIVVGVQIVGIRASDCVDHSGLRVRRPVTGAPEAVVVGRSLR